MKQPFRPKQHGQRFTWLLALVLICCTPLGASAQDIRVTVNASYAEYLLGMVCTGKDVDEEYLRTYAPLQSQIEHHTSMSNRRNFDAFLTSLKAASRCEVPENDVFRFAPIIEDKAKFETVVSFFKQQGPAIESFVGETLAPYLPTDLDYEGDLILSIIGNPCGGFAVSGRFYLALNCLAGAYQEDFETAKLISTHEIFHDMQHNFFFEKGMDFKDVTTPDEGYRFLFQQLLMEGTAEYVADSRHITGSGFLSTLLKGFSDNGNAYMAQHIRTFGYAADVIGTYPDWRARLHDMFMMGFTGAGRQLFYYAGAGMARHMEETLGREPLVCVMHLPAEQFILAYQSTALSSPSEVAVPLNPAMIAIANSMSNEHPAGLRYESCLK
ncbi:DUF5700 domain-containing putative Zn-dependent protease [Kordiimonas sp.]|uniref:DUF5700 domain-containing putative Zn-dependent protease n=1 Tax=Kordiimonas sp. TaxID=1970157 RepID=UPI003A8D5788